MKLKKRVKAALYQFFKEEIDRNFGVIGNKTNNTFETKVIHSHVDFETINVDFNIISHSVSNHENEYERCLQEAKDCILDSITRNIKIESYNLIDPEYAYRRKIKASVLIGKQS